MCNYFFKVYEPYLTYVITFNCIELEDQKERLIEKFKKKNENLEVERQQLVNEQKHFEAQKKKLYEGIL